jgi:hypothetical protein
VRRGDGDMEERASVEYQIIPMVWSNNETEFNMNRVQTLGKFNHRLDSSWDDVLNKLDERISVTLYEKMFDTLQIEGEFGGRKVFSDYELKYYDRKDDSGDDGVVSIKKGTYLDWKNDSIMKLNSYNYNIVPIENDDNLFDY